MAEQQHSELRFPILAQDGSIEPLAWIETLAVAYFPEDQDRRRAWKAAWIAKIYTDLQRSDPEEARTWLPTLPECVVDLYQARETPASLLQAGQTRLVWGELAGEIFCILLSCAEWHRPASFRGIRGVLVDYYKSRTGADGQRLPASAGSLCRDSVET